MSAVKEVTQEVKWAYGIKDERTRSMNRQFFKASKSIPAAVLYSVIKEIGRHNNFSPTIVTRFISSVDPAARVVVARECSPCLYIRTGKNTAMDTALRLAKADKVDRMSNGWIRAWWD